MRVREMQSAVDSVRVGVAYDKNVFVCKLWLHGRLLFRRVMNVVRKSVTEVQYLIKDGQEMGRNEAAPLSQTNIIDMWLLFEYWSDITLSMT